VTLINLSIQYQGLIKRWRLGIPTRESRDFFRKRKATFSIKIPNNELFETQTKCGCIDFSNGCEKTKKGYDIYDSRIHEWLEKSGHKNPEKIEFDWNEPKKFYHFENFYKNEVNINRMENIIPNKLYKAVYNLYIQTWENGSAKRYKKVYLHLNL
jgi:hypothetical protein